ncbi:MAG: substrate-binding domain-containing protein, partial [Cyanobacteriota bacterium]|nr:substrate-binding domain-containing protein [Cyanobacteriota bacterium]
MTRLIPIVLSVALAVVSPPLVASARDRALFGQSPSSSVNSPKVLKIESSSSLDVINQTLKQHFEPNFQGRIVTFPSRDAEAALSALREGKIDLAAIGRGLTQEEKKEGFVALPLPRQKMAVIISSKNPCRGSLTDKQFAKIFRGEITDWSQVGGKPGPIRFIDRPEKSDTRRALGAYDIFKETGLVTGSTASSVEEDRTEAVIQALGEDGIGYAIAHQVANSQEVRIVPLHGTTPDDPRYPFSQPAVYVYRASNSNPALQDFVDFVNSETGRDAIAANLSRSLAAGSDATVDETPSPELESSQATPSPDNGESNSNAAVSSNSEATSNTVPSETETTSSAESPNSETDANPALVAPTETATGTLPSTTEEEQDNLPWLWGLLPLGLLALLIGWLLYKNRALEPATTLAGTSPSGNENTVGFFPAPSDDGSQLPSTSSKTEPIPNHPSPPSQIEEPAASTASESDDRIVSSPSTFPEHSAVPDSPILTSAVGAVLGGNTSESNSSPSNSELTPEDSSTPSDSSENANSTLLDSAILAGAAGAVLGGDTNESEPSPSPSELTSEETLTFSPSSEESKGKTSSTIIPSKHTDYQIRLVPDDLYFANAYWDIPNLENLQNRVSQDEPIALRLYEVVELDLMLPLPQNWQHYECDVWAKHWYFYVPHDGNYWTELGYVDRENQWVCLA